MGYTILTPNLGTLPAAADLSAKQFYLVKENGSAQAALGATAGEKVLGPLQNDPESGDAANVQCWGAAKVIFGGTVDEGDLLTTDANGKAVKSTAVGDYVFGTALVSGVSGDIGTAMVMHQGYMPVKTWSFTIALAKLANGDIITGFTPGFAGTITKFEAWVVDPATTAAKAATLNLEIGTTNLTGGTIALTSANCTPLGNVVASAAITAAYTFTATDTISVEAASVTTFIEGTVTIHIEARVGA